jgi:hypothetical protein
MPSAPRHPEAEGRALVRLTESHTAGVSIDRRPLGLPEFSAPAADRPTAGDRRRPPQVDRALFLPPPSTELPVSPVRRQLAGGGLTFSDGD